MGAAGSALANSCRPERRYLKGMTAHEYWSEEAWPENREVLECLNLKHDKARVVFDAFVAVDIDNSGQMSLAGRRGHAANHTL